MRRKSLQAAVALALCAPALALAQAFEAVDTIPWPYLGGYPAYPADPLRPTRIYARAGFLTDSNLFRFSDSVDTAAFTGNSRRGDTIMRAGAGIQHEQRVVGRQSVRLAASGDLYGFSTYSQMDHFAYNARGEWLWEFTNDFSGIVGWDHRKRLIDLAQLQRPIKTMVTENHAYVNGAYRLGPSFRLRGSLDGVRAERDNDPDNASRSRANGVTGGVDYVSALGNTVGAEVRRTTGNSPTPVVINTTPIDNEFEEREVAAVASWAVTQQIRTTGRVGRTKRTHRQFPVLDFQGTTWTAAVDWTPLNKTGFNFTFYRAPRTIIDITASYVLTRGFTIGPRWAPTEKLVFSAYFVRERQHYSDPANPVLGSPERDETIRTWRLAAGWEPVRFLELSAGFEHGIRSSNSIGRDFDYNQLMLNARYRY
jgi:exopolysaccharide biosynthesis operon protein EpsL